MEQSGFRVTEEDDGAQVLVTVRGELDLATAEQLDACLARLADRRRSTLLDLRPLTFMDSSGLRSLMIARERSIDGWQLRIIPPQGEAREALRVSGVESHLPLVEP